MRTLFPALPMVLLILLAATWTAVPATGTVSGRAEAERLIQRVRAAQEKLPAWSARLLIDIDLPGMRVKGRQAGLRFTPPDSFSFEAKGFVLLPRRAMMWTADSLFAGLSEPRRLPPRAGDPPHSVRLAGSFREDGLLARMDYCVDTLRWLVTQVSTWHDTLETLRLENDWLSVGGHWLPAAVRVELALSPELQRHYERLRGAMRQRKTPREGRGSIRLVLDGHRILVADSPRGGGKR